MKYFIDTEFIEGKQERPLLLKGRLGNILLGNPKPTIDLISIGIKAEDGREYYAISKEFNLKEAWNRYDIKKEWYSIDESNQSTRDIKVYWLRDNVLQPIFYDMLEQTLGAKGIIIGTEFIPALSFNYYNFKRLLKKCGKTNKQIAEEAERFIIHNNHINWSTNQLVDDKTHQPVEFYGYYADYDWVIFCWLFGRMIDLPKGFPMYCIDLKQIIDEKESKLTFLNNTFVIDNDVYRNISKLKQLPNYPKQFNEHNALDDAKWNYELYKFLQKL